MTTTTTNGREEFPPIINGPHSDPEYYYMLNSHTRPIGIAEGRRVSQNLPPVAGSRRRGESMPLQGETGDMGHQWPPLRHVNLIRQKVQDWKDSWKNGWKEGEHGVSHTTGKLIRFWTREDEEDDGQEDPFYFAQIDAALTHIYLKEVGDPEIAELLANENEKYNAGIDRICHKMATGAGKTLLMAMLIVWQTANWKADQDAGVEKSKYTNRFLCLTPGITVKERLQEGLSPSNAKSEYNQFSIVPPGMEDVISSAQVNVANFHQMKPQLSTFYPSANADKLLNGGANPVSEDEAAMRYETVDDVIKRVAGSHGERILVFNDESHHCHRGDPNRPPQDTVWFGALRDIHNSEKLLYAADLSATPIYIAQSNPRPVEWIVSDYSLVDAMEAGLVKIPRVPANPGSTGWDDMATLKYRDIYAHSTAAERRDVKMENPGSSQTLKEAFRLLYADYAKVDDDWKDRREIPVMAVVMNVVKNANSMYQYIANDPDNAPLLANGETDETPNTIIVHSKIEEGAKAGGPIGKAMSELAEKFRKAYQSEFQPGDNTEEIIRRVMNTVGKEGQPGENVRCVISVGMLTEGWDAKTVTHMLGFRKFGSSLLCEQVAGRTLRRVTHDLSNDGKYPAEYAQILGIPFPQYLEADPVPPPPPSPATKIFARTDTHSRYRVSWPNVIGYNKGADLSDAISVLPRENVAERPFVIGTPSKNEVTARGIAGRMSLLSDEDASWSTTKRRSLYFIATAANFLVQEIIGDMMDAVGFRGTRRAARLFAQTLVAAKDYAARGILLPDTKSGSERWPGRDDLESLASAGEWLARSVDITAPNKDGGVSPAMMSAQLSAARPWMHTSDLREYDARVSEDKIYGPARKSEVNYAHCDSGWEREVAATLDILPEITRWARNHRLGWNIPYVSDGALKRYYPDFVAVSKLPDGKELHLVIEVKGRLHEFDADKRRWTESYWIPSVNERVECGEASGRVWAYLNIGEKEYIAENGVEKAIKSSVEFHTAERRRESAA